MACAESFNGQLLKLQIVQRLPSPSFLQILGKQFLTRRPTLGLVQLNGVRFFTANLNMVPDVLYMGSLGQDAQKPKELEFCLKREVSITAIE